eukprot:1967561-Amphidinium_carterae.1
MPARLRLRKENFAQRGQSEAYDQQQILQESILQSYIQYHPTSGYNKGTEEVTSVYNHVEIYTWHDELSQTRQH